MKTLFLCLAALAAPLHAGGLVPSRIPASAKWVAHADFDAMRGSGTGRAVFARIEADHGPKLHAFKRMFSLHPLEDLHGLTLYGDGRPDRAVALIDATVDRAHVEDVVKGADGYSAATYAGLTVHSWKDHGRVQHAAFLSDTLVAFSAQEDLLHEALDLAKAKPAAQDDSFLTAAGGHSLLFARARLAEITPENGARIARMAKNVELAADENSGRFLLRARVETDSAGHAAVLHRILDGVIALSEIGDRKLDGLDLQSAITPVSGSPGLYVTLSLPVAEWISLMEKAVAEKAAKSAR